MEVNAKARYIRISPRKVRLVADLVRGLDVAHAAAQLRFMRKLAARPVLKVIMSAAANAEHNFKIPSGGLYVKTITVDEGPTLHRWRARAFGRAASIKKRSSHITVVLGERGISGSPKGEVASAVVKEEAEKPAEKKASAPKKKAASKEAEAKKADAASDDKAS